MARPGHAQPDVRSVAATLLRQARALPQRDIFGELGCIPPAVGKALVQHGTRLARLPPGTCQAPLGLDVADLIERHAPGESINSIAGHLKVSRGTRTQEAFTLSCFHVSLSMLSVGCGGYAERELIMQFGDVAAVDLYCVLVAAPSALVILGLAPPAIDRCDRPHLEETSGLSSEGFARAPARSRSARPSFGYTTRKGAQRFRAALPLDTGTMWSKF
jgi:hypothetical protein